MEVSIRAVDALPNVSKIPPRVTESTYSSNPLTTDQRRVTEQQHQKGVKTAQTEQAHAETKQKQAHDAMVDVMGAVERLYAQDQSFMHQNAEARLVEVIVHPNTEQAQQLTGFSLSRERGNHQDTGFIWDGGRLFQVEGNGGELGQALMNQVGCTGESAQAFWATLHQQAVNEFGRIAIAGNKVNMSLKQIEFTDQSILKRLGLTDIPESPNNNLTTYSTPFDVYQG